MMVQRMVYVDQHRLGSPILKEVGNYTYLDLGSSNGYVWTLFKVIQE